MTKSPSLKVFLILSLVFHAIGSLTLYFAKTLKTSTKDESITVSLLNAEEFKEIAKTREAFKKKPLLLKNQIVEQDEGPSKDEAPENARFLSAKNQKVQKQTVAAQRGQFQNMKKSSSEAKKQLAANLFKSFDANEAYQRQKSADLKATTGEDTKVAETSQSSDYIKDVEVGLETVLNTREFKYYSYYNRIRKQLAQHWEGRVRDKLSKLFREGRAPAATHQDRVTKLMIVLNDRGTLVRVQVISDSGVSDLDDAAIEAFRAAAPFPNPPKGIVEGDGTVKIRWDFVLES